MSARASFIGLSRDALALRGGGDMISRRRLKDALTRIVYAVNTLRAVPVLKKGGGAAEKSVERALKSVLCNGSTVEEAAWFDRIERLRRELAGSSEEISIMDFGAGTAGDGLTEEDMYRGRLCTRKLGDVCENTSKRQLWAEMMFRLIRELKPSVCLELGTSLGISGAYMGAAAELNGHGRVTTLEGADSLARIARGNFDRLGLKRVDVTVGRFQDTMETVLGELEHVDFAFIDGHHDEKATLDYFDKLYPFLTENAVVVFDDINWSDGMKRAWGAISSDKRVRVPVDLKSMGICIV